MNCRYSRFGEIPQKKNPKLLFVYNQDSYSRETFLELFFSELQQHKKRLKKLNLLNIYYGILKNIHCVRVPGKLFSKQDVVCDFSQTLTPETETPLFFADQSTELLKVQNFMSVLLFRDISKYYLQILFYSFAWVQFKQ